MKSDWELKSTPNIDKMLKTASIFKGEQDNVIYGLAIINPTNQAFFRLVDGF